MGNATGALYEFGPYRLDSLRRLLIREGRHLAIPPKTFDLLLLLVEGRGRVFTKKELMNALWPDTFVEEANLSFQISALRKVLGETGTDWIETLPRYGYRFSRDVVEIEANGPSDSSFRTASQPPTPAEVRPHPAEKFENGQPAAPAPAASRLPRWFYWIATSVATTAALVFAWLYLRQEPSRQREVRFLVSPPDRVSMPDIDSMSVSPDGERLVFIGVAADGRRQLWLRSLGSLAASPLAGTELVDSAFWSWDSRSVAFFAGGKLKTLDLESSATQTVCDTPVGRSSGTWSRDGVILFETTERPEIYRVAATGGEPARLRRVDTASGEIRHSAPQFLPDGRHFVYFVQSERLENAGIYLGALDSSTSKRLVNSNTNAAYAGVGANAGYLLFTRGTDLMAQAFDMAKLGLTGAPFQVAERVLVAVAGGTSRVAVSASGNGVLAYRTRVDTGSSELVWLDRQGKRTGRVGEPGDYSNPSLSPDEKRLVVSRMDVRSRTRDLWLFDLATGAASRFTFDPADETNAVWSPDSRRIAFNMLRNGVIDIYQKEVAGASQPKLLLHSGENDFIHQWSPDGRLLLYRIGPITWALPLEGNIRSWGPYAMENARISPNGRWVAYTSNQSGRSEVYVQSFPPSEGKWQVSTDGGMEPSWRKDGKELYYTGGDKLIAMDVKTDAPVFEPGLAKPLFAVHLEATTRRSRYEAAANGRRFLFNLPVESSSPVTVAINWAQGRVR
jgi:Tol biopolymer transport system component/DNA-binding winged helix-turn-helix (wHTH) protein